MKLLLCQSDSVAITEPIQRHEAHIVARRGVLGPGVTQTHQQKVAHDQTFFASAASSAFVFEPRGTAIRATA